MRLRLKKAITYILNREDVLKNYLEDVRCSLSNNLSENSIRPVTLARKNWIFFFSDKPDGAHVNTVYLSLIAMAKAYDLNIYEYLMFLLEYRPNTEMSDEELDQLTP